MNRSTALEALASLVFSVLASVASLPAMAADAASGAQAVDAESELARKLANPIASLISLPLQFNYDSGIGAEDGSQSLLNIQPVIPFSISENWNLITRTIIPLLDMNDVPAGSSKSGLGDIVASQFFSPKAMTKRGWTWGVGPVWLLPTATDDTLGTDQFGLGPTAVALKQQGPWTFGVLANHIWSVAGEDEAEDVNNTFLQPFLAYVTRTHTTFSLNTESTYSWESNAWSVPINFSVAQMLKFGSQPVQVSIGARYWADSPRGGAEGWGGRFQVNFIFPK